MVGEIAGSRPVEIVIIGGGVAGTAAIKAGIGLGAKITVLDIDPSRLKLLRSRYGKDIEILYSNSKNIKKCIKKADMVINAVFYKPTIQKKHIITRSMLKQMEPGSVIIDVSCDEGGALETCKITTHENPIYLVNDIIHYCVENIPGSVPKTASYVLSNSILPYVRKVADKGFFKAIKEDVVLRRGLITAYGKLLHPEAAICQQLEWYPLEKFLVEMEVSS